MSDIIRLFLDFSFKAVWAVKYRLLQIINVDH
jgi:hypothetical protein